MHRCAAVLVLLLSLTASRSTTGAVGAAASVDCASFVVQEDAQAVLDAGREDRFGLDPDGDGRACEELPPRRGAEAGPPDAIPASAEAAEVSRVLAGDLIRVQVGGTVETIRLAGIAAPHPDGGASECFGTEAAEHLDGMLTGRTVFLERDAADRDGYGNPLRYVWFEGKTDGRPYLANEVLVARGYAVVEAPPSAKYTDRLLAAQDAARAEGVGLWPACGAIGVPGAVAGTFPDPIDADVDGFWRKVFARASRSDYAAPRVVVFSAPILTACGRAYLDSAAFYCPLDQSIYANAAFRAELQALYGERIWALVVAHEWAHNVEEQLGLLEGDTPFLSITLELQADCMAGAYARNAERRGVLLLEDVEAAAALMGEIGDGGGVRLSDPGAHGSGAERVSSFQRGYQDGVEGCGIDL